MKNSRQKTIKRKIGFGAFARVVSLIFVVLAICLSIQVVMLNILPMVLMIPVIAVILLISLVLFLVTNFRVKNQFVKILCMTLIFVLTIGYGLGNFYVFKVSRMFDNVTNLTDRTTNTVSVMVPQGSSIQSMKDLDGARIGIIPSLDSETVGTPKCLEDLKNNGINVQTFEYPTLNDMLFDMFQNQNTDGIILSDGSEGVVHSLGTYDNLNTMVNRVHKTVYYTDKTKQQASSLNRVKSITTDAFTILLSGNDSYGSLAENSRSDVNMLVTINPMTQTVLMTSIPRDFYVPLACAEGVENCPEGEFDKLTHSGLYGVETTDKTIEEFLGVPINYTVRVNFSSLVNLVDSLGGVDVFVDEGLAVDTFAANGTPGVSEGWNHLEGERALAFSRERHAYQDGDNQRVRNQQIVLEAMVHKIASPSMIVNFGSFVDALAGAFETNMPSDQILSFIRYQFTLQPNWKFESYSLYGESMLEYCVSLGDYASVAKAFIPTIECGREKIEAVLQGKSSKDIPDAEIVITDESQFLNPEKKEGNTETPIVQEPVYEQPVYEEPPVYDGGMTDQMPEDNYGYDDGMIDEDVSQGDDGYIESDPDQGYEEW